MQSPGARDGTGVRRERQLGRRYDVPLRLRGRQLRRGMPAGRPSVQQQQCANLSVRGTVGYERDLQSSDLHEQRMRRVHAWRHALQGRRDPAVVRRRRALDGRSGVRPRSVSRKNLHRMPADGDEVSRHDDPADMRRYRQLVEQHELRFGGLHRKPLRRLRAWCESVSRRHDATGLRHQRQLGRQHELRAGGLYRYDVHRVQAGREAM